MQTVAARLLLVSLFALAGCNRATLQHFDAGPHAVRVVDELTVSDPEKDRDLTVRLLYPAGDGPFPVVIFSAGAFCYPQMYDGVTAHWVSHGYIVVAPNHLDSPNHAEPPGPDQYDDFLPSRVRDTSFLLDALPDIGVQANIRDKLDMDRIAIGGHSFGAVIAMIKIGLNLKDYDQQVWGVSFDERFRAAILMSGVGRGMPEMADDAFDGLRRPLLATGGTRDVGRVDIGELTPEEWRLQPFLLAPPGDKYALITEGSDHYMGGLICNTELGGEPDLEAMQNVRAISTVFLDAHVKSDPAALRYLNKADVHRLTEGSARLRVKGNN